MAPERIPLFIIHKRRLVHAAPDGSWAWQTRRMDESLKAIEASLGDKDTFYLYDSEGVSAGAPDHEFSQRLERRQLFPWAHPGCRASEDAMDAFFAGAETLTVEPRHMEEAVLLDLFAAAEADIHLAYPFSGRALHPEARASDLHRKAADLGAAGIVLVPAPDTDARYLAAFADELRRHGSSTSLLGIAGPWARPTPAQEAGFDRIIVPPVGRPAA